MIDDTLAAVKPSAQSNSASAVFPAFSHAVLLDYRPVNVSTFVAFSYARPRLSNRRRVCLSLRLSVRLSHAGTDSKLKKRMRFPPSGSLGVQFFFYQTPCLRSRGRPLAMASNKTGGQNRRRNADFQPISHIYL